MNKKILKEQLNKCLSSIDTTDALIVFKGLPKDIEQGYHTANFDKLFDKNKNLTKKWLEFSSNDYKFISYEDYLYFYNFIIGNEYNNIFIIDNNIFNNFYPLITDIPDDIKNKLVDFFDEDSDSNSDIQSGEDYTKLYSNMEKRGDNYFITYNDNISTQPNIRVIPLFSEDKYDKFRTDNSAQNINVDNIINIQEDSDYLLLLDKFLNTDEKIYFKLDYFNSESINFKEQLYILSNYFDNVFLVETQELLLEEIVSGNDKEYLRILKEYWGYDDFRTLDIYDFEEAKRGNKKVKTISQLNIIREMVNQVENVLDDKEYDCRDVFVTAPTGSGKSIMFQIPAIYLAEKYNLLTLVISPLIGLMKDQVYNLEEKGYKYSRTINSDISPLVKDEIINDVKEGNCHILYLSPESLLAKTDISQLIGERQIGMVIVDEAHIVTTWGKQFRPDYWYLGDHIRKLRKNQRKKSKDSRDFLLATFTATAIFGGPEDMYGETINSLNMHIPTISYLGYVKRNDIDIQITEKEKINKRTEYDLDKFETLYNLVQNSTLEDKKTLIYFPTVPLIDQFYDYCRTHKLNNVVKYYGPMEKEEKDNNYDVFKNNQKLIMLATKAFGMGVDIKDIEIVAHYAPTGNVCDYVQEIGRAARDPKIKGKAIYSHMANDFKYINRLHGLSAIKKYQLINVMKKVYELFNEKLNNQKTLYFSKKRNTILVDAENFTYIFKSPFDDISKNDKSNLINKAKTALLLIEKDYIQKFGYSPIAMRPAQVFKDGFFYIDKSILPGLIKAYGKSTFEYIFNTDNIYKINMEEIWEMDYEDKMSFPKFKYYLYSGKDEVKKHSLNKILPAYKFKVEETNNKLALLIENVLFQLLNKSVNQSSVLTVESDKTLKDKDSNISNYLRKRIDSLSVYKSDSIANILIATMNNYMRNNYNKSMNTRLYKTKIMSGVETYQFTRGVVDFQEWINKTRTYIRNNNVDNINKNNDKDNVMELYVVKRKNETILEEIMTVLGFLEAIGKVKFEIAGGENSQIYIKVNSTKQLIEIAEERSYYKNNLLEKISDRHELSVKMLEYLFQNKFDSGTIWNLLEDYFLGKMPAEIEDFVGNNTNLRQKIKQKKHTGAYNAKLDEKGSTNEGETYETIFNELLDGYEEGYITDNQNSCLNSILQIKDIDGLEKPYISPKISYFNGEKQSFCPALCWEKARIILFIDSEDFEQHRNIDWKVFCSDDNFNVSDFETALRGE